MENKLELIIIIFIFSLGLFLANNFFGWNIITGNTVSQGIVELTITSPPSEEVPGAVSGGGGGGVLGWQKEYIKVDPKSIKILLRDADSFTQSLKITSLYDKDLELVFDSISIKDFLSFSETGMSLKPGERKTLDLIFQSNLNTLKGVYTGKILIYYNNKVIKEVPVILEIETNKKLFDLTITIPPEFRTIKAGENLPILVTIFDITNLGKSEVNMEYQIRDFSGNILSSVKENLTVEDQISFTKIMATPNRIASGDYVADVILRKGSTISTASQIFTISEAPYEEVPMSNSNLSIILLSIIAALFVVMIIVLYEFKKASKRMIHKKHRKR